MGQMTAKERICDTETNIPLWEVGDEEEEGEIQRVQSNPVKKV